MVKCHNNGPSKTNIYNICEQGLSELEQVRCAAKGTLVTICGTVNS